MTLPVGDPLISDSFWRASALVGLVETVSAFDCDRAGRVATEAESIIVTISDHPLRERVLARLVEAVAVSGDGGRAETLAAKIMDSFRRAQALVRLVRVLALADPDRALRLATQSTAVAVQITDLSQRAEVLLGLAEVVAAGDPDWLVRVEYAIMSEVLAAPAIEPWRRDHVLVRLAEVVARSGAYDRAEALAAEIAELSTRARLLIHLVELLAADRSDPDRVARLADEATALAHGSRIHPASPISRDSPILVSLERVVRARLLTELAEALAVADPDRAAQLVNESETRAREVLDHYGRAVMLIKVARAVAVSDFDRAARLAKDAERIAAHQSEDFARNTLLISLVEVMAVGGAYDRAESLAAQISNPSGRAQALLDLVAAVNPGDHDRAMRLLSEVEALAEQITDRDSRAGMLIALAMTLLRIATPDDDNRSPLVRWTRRLLVEAIVSDSWITAVSALKRVDPVAISSLVDDLVARWKLAGGPLNSTT